MHTDSTSSHRAKENILHKQTKTKIEQYQLKWLKWTTIRIFSDQEGQLYCNITLGYLTLHYLICYVI